MDGGSFDSLFVESYNAYDVHLDTEKGEKMRTKNKNILKHL